MAANARSTLGHQMVLITLNNPEPNVNFTKSKMKIGNLLNNKVQSNINTLSEFLFLVSNI